MKITSEEQEIIRRFRKLSNSQKKAVLASENAFIEWIKAVAKWIWEKLMEQLELGISELFETLRRQFFGS